MTLRTKKGGPPLFPEDIRKVEEEIGVTLPDDYKAFLLAHNGGAPNRPSFPVEGMPKYSSMDIGYFYGINRMECSNIDYTYNCFKGRMPPNFFPIADTGSGEQVCLALWGRDKGAVYLWDWYDQQTPPSYKNVYVIAKSFREFLDNLYYEPYVPEDETEAERIVRENDIKAFEGLLRSGYDLETTDEYGVTMMERAAVKNRTDLIQLLFEHGAQLRDALSIAKQNYEFFEEHKASVELIERLMRERH